jgi:PEP-CTERM motif
MLDTPYVCESGFGAMGMGCPATTPMTDEFIPSYVDVFNMFIESNQVFMGTTYQVLFGGFTWGFTYTATDVPEPSTWAMLVLGFAGLGGLGYRRGRRPAAGMATA